MKTLLMAAAAVAVLGAASAAQALTPAYEYANAGTLNDSRPFTLGFEFSLSGSTTVEALGYWEGMVDPSESVGLWDSGGTLLASATVTTGSAHIGHFLWTSISSLSLGAGTYVIGGTYNGGLFASNASGVVTMPGYTWITDEQLFGTGLNFPTVTTSGAYGVNGIPEVNFSTSGIGSVPEPATWALMLGGFGLAGAALRRRKAIAA